MPLYDYKCQKCGDIFEHLQSSDSKKLKRCKKCKGKLDRLVCSGIAVKFNGSGFYQTDYKSKNK